MRLKHPEQSKANVDIYRRRSVMPLSHKCLVMYSKTQCWAVYPECQWYELDKGA